MNKCKHNVVECKIEYKERKAKVGERETSCCVFGTFFNFDPRAATDQGRGWPNAIQGASADSCRTWSSGRAEPTEAEVKTRSPLRVSAKAAGN